MKYKIILLFIAILITGQSYAQYLSAFTGRDTDFYSGDGGLAIAATTSAVDRICQDKEGNTYIGDQDTHGAYIRKVTRATGIIDRIAGGGTSGADGPAKSVKLSNGLFGLCIDTAGNLLLSDTYRLRKLDQKTGMVTTIAGTGAKGYAGDGGPATAAKFYPVGPIAVDSSNNIYVDDYANFVIRRIDAVTGIVTTIAGTPGVSDATGDGGPATAATLGGPATVSFYGGMHDICINKQTGDLYVADVRHVRVIHTSTGIINTFAGALPSYGATGDGGPAAVAHFADIPSLACDKKGNLYIGGLINVRFVDIATGIVTTFAGNGSTNGIHNYEDHGQPATSGRVAPLGICVDSCDNVYVVNNSCFVWEITPGEGPTPCIQGPALEVPATAVQANELQIFPNPANGNFTIHLPAGNGTVHITITNALGMKVEEINAPPDTQQNIQLNGPPGNYFVNVQSGGERWCRTVIMAE